MENFKYFGLIGEKLTHSFSKKYFSEKFEKENIQNASYDLYELPKIHDFPILLNQKTFSGLNVTIPYKTLVMEYLDEIDNTAAEIGAVNTIKFLNGKTKGYNTDVLGSYKEIKTLIGRKKVNNALILGSGGASKAIQHCLKTMQIPYKIVSRKNGDLLYQDLSKNDVRNSRLIINCTPLGTFPKINEAPDIPYEFLTDKHLLFDLVYNPEKSLFLAHGEAKNAQILNGYSMLVEQAEASWKIWNSN